MASSPILTNCNVENIVGTAITLQGFKNWQGAVADQGSYPDQIKANGTAKVQHEGNSNGSIGAVVYRITISDTKCFDVMVAWLNPPNSANKTYTLVDQPGSFTDARWAAIFNELFQSGTTGQSELEGCTSKVEIGNGNFPKFTAKIST